MLANVTANQIHNPVLSDLLAPRSWAASAAVKLIEMCSDAKPAMLCGVALAGSCRKSSRWSSRMPCRRVTSDTGSSAKSRGKA